MRNRRGFSFIEMMVVLALIGIFVGVGARKLLTNNTKIKSTVRRFAVSIKKLRSQAQIKNKTFRMVFNFPIKKTEVQTYWVESTDKKALLLSEEKREELEDAQRDKFGDAKKLDPQGFKMVGKTPESLPEGLFFESVEIAGQDRPFTEGRVYIYFFPEGFVQEAAIHITDRAKLNWTLAVHPLTGRVDILTKDVPLEDLTEE